jgi:hypothetical protein
MTGPTNSPQFEQLTLDLQEGGLSCVLKNKQENDGNTLDFLTTPSHSYNPL